MNCTTANTSLSAGSMLYYAQKVEGNNLQHLGFGTSNAKPLTFSFWVKSNKTGIYTSELYNSDSTRQISKTFTIDTANTWEYKVINFPADTTGSFNADANLSLWVFIHLASGSDRNSGTLNDDAWAANTNPNRISSSNVNLADSTSNEIFMTGWQLEVGKNATEFEHRSYGEELQLCMRYCQRYTDLMAAGVVSNSTFTWHPYTFSTQFRATPTLTVNNLGRVVKENVAWYPNINVSLNDQSPSNTNLLCEQSNNYMSNLDPCRLGYDCDLTFSAEL